jgi:MFS family permease
MRVAAAGSGARLFTPNFLLLWVTSFGLFASFHLLLPTLPLYVLQLGGSESQVGLIIGVLTISSVLSRPWVGREADRRGKKRLLVWGAVAFLAAMAAYNLAYTVPLLLLLRLFHGGAWAATTTSATALIADIAPETRRGEAMGYYGMAANVAMAVGPLAGVALVEAFGFTQLFGAGVGLALVALLIASRIREPAVARPAQQAPSGKGFLLYRPSLFPSSVIFAVTLTYGGVVSFLPLLAYGHQINPGLFFTIYALFLLMARPLGGQIADRLGRPAAVIPGLAFMALGLGTLAFSTELSHFVVVAVLYGIGFAFVHPALLALTVDRAAPQERGAAMGTFSAAFDLGIGLGSILLGLLLDRTSFQVIYLTTAGVATAGMLVFALGSRRRGPIGASRAGEGDLC